MKRIKFLPLLSVIGLLSGCSLLNQAKAPVFGTQGEEVKYTEFMNTYKNSIKNKDLDPETNRIFNDSIIKYTRSSISSSITKYDGKEVNKLESKSIIKGENQYDYRSLVAKTSVNGEASTVQTTPLGTSNTKQAAKQEIYYQFGYDGGVEALLAVDTKSKQYTQYIPYSNYDEESVIFNTLLRNQLFEMYSGFNSECPQASGAANGYRFFINNDDIFTYSLERETKSNGTSINGQKYSEIITKRKLKYQIRLENGKQHFMCSDETEVTTTITKAENGYKVGDVLIETEKRYEERELTSKDVSLKGIDTANYRSTTYINVNF
jgi:hypothetical protein